MLSTSSDLFTLASEMCACSKEVERIYDGTSSISTSRVRMKFTFDAHVHVRDRCCVLSLPTSSIVHSIVPTTRVLHVHARAHSRTRVRQRSREVVDIARAHDSRGRARATTTRDACARRTCADRVHDVRRRAHEVLAPREHRARPATTAIGRAGDASRRHGAIDAPIRPRETRASPARRAGLRV